LNGFENGSVQILSNLSIFLNQFSESFASKCCKKTNGEHLILVEITMVCIPFEFPNPPQHNFASLPA